MVTWPWKITYMKKKCFMTKCSTYHIDEKCQYNRESGASCCGKNNIDKENVSNWVYYMEPCIVNTHTHKRKHDVQSIFHISLAPLPSNRHHRSSGDCLEGKGENYQVCSVQYCVQQLCTVRCTHIWTKLTVLWIGFCFIGPISLCLDSFLYCALLCVVCMRRFVTRWGGPGGIETYP